MKRIFALVLSLALLLSAAALAAQLRARGILVRHWDKERIGDYLRITIGTMQEMQALEAAIEMIFGRA